MSGRIKNRGGRDRVDELVGNFIMSVKKRIDLTETATDEAYKNLCETMEKQGVFAGCGNCDDKWVIGKWEDEEDYLAWACAMFGTPNEVRDPQERSK